MAGLSNAEVDQIIALLFRLNAAGTAIIMIEHIMRAVTAFAERLVVFVAGRKIADGPPRDGAGAARRGGRLSWPAVGLEIAGIDAGYGAVRVLEGVSLSVPAGRDGGAARHQRQRQDHADAQHHGPDPPDRRHASAPCSTAPPPTWSASRRRQVVELGIVLVPEGRRLFPRLTVEQNLRLGAYRATAPGRRWPRTWRCAYELFPAAGGAPRPAGRQHERRRAADGGARPRA